MKFTQRKFFYRGAAASSAGATLLGVTAVLTGCGGGGGTQLSSLPPGTPPGTRTFYGPVNQILVGASLLVKVGRGFVTLDANNKPVQVGCELFDEAVKNLPSPPPHGPDIYGINLPAESVYTPFTYIAISYWSGSLPRGAVNVPHFDPVFGIGPPQVPDPPDYAKEKTAVAAAEIPKDFVSALDVPLLVDPQDAVAPAIGVAYENPVLPQPHLVHGWDTVGQAYFFYKGHLNGYALTIANKFLLEQEKGDAPAVPAIVKQFNQPALYPRAGYYPHHWDVLRNEGNKSHIFVMDDFQPAANAIP